MKKFLILGKTNPPASPFAKRGCRGILLNCSPSMLGSLFKVQYKILGSEAGSFKAGNSPASPSLLWGLVVSVKEKATDESIPRGSPLPVPGSRPSELWR